jgi:hypothetical protein
MKCIPGALVFAALAVAIPAVSQTERGNWELSLAGNAGSVSLSYERTGTGTNYSSDGEAQSYFGLDVRVGVYIAEGLSIEPEIYLLAVEKVQPAFNIGGNASYTFSIPESPVKPFLIAGYGIGNGIPMMQRLMRRSSGDFEIPVLRAGGGVKVFLSRQIALKVEYRYERFFHEETSSYYSSSSTMNTTWNYHNILFGLSVFLPGGE